MNASSGYRWLYARVTTGMDERRRLGVDVVLGIPGAKEELARLRQTDFAGLVGMDA